MFKRLKQKRGIKSNFQFWLIYGIFAISGTASTFVNIPLFAFPGVDESNENWVMVITYLLAIIPAYFALLLFYGSVFEQFRFFRAFTKKIFGRFFTSGKSFRHKEYICLTENPMS